MKVAIVGYGVEGQAAAEYWARKGAQVTICDSDPDKIVPSPFTARLGLDIDGGKGYLSGLGNFDQIVHSPGIRVDQILAANPIFPGLKRRITSPTQEFFQNCPAPIIGVTGTKGKGTTSTLIAQILEAAGKTVWLGGNIGRPALEFLLEVKEEDVVVLELSSFQLMDLELSPEIGVCLMISQDHLDWHLDMQEYLKAKSQMFAHQRSSDMAIYKSGDERSHSIASVTNGRLIPYGENPGAKVAGDGIEIDGEIICRVGEVGLAGAHNLENVCAAITATWEFTDHNKTAIRTAVLAFKGLEHRLEYSGELGGVAYYDDSFATTPETAIAAIKSFSQPKVIILGGSDKGSEYDELAQIVASSGVIHAFLIGETAPKIQHALRKAGFDHFTLGMTEMKKVVEACYHITDPGDVVLLSPACASFGMFKNYKERGNQFKSSVKEIMRQLTSHEEK